MLVRLLVFLVVFAACEGPVGPPGERGEEGEVGLPGKDGVDGKDGKDGRDGEDGRDGIDLWVQVIEGTILTQNYTELNPGWVSIPLSNSSGEPTVLFLGIESENGVYIRIDFTAVLWYEGENKTVRGMTGWYVLLPDRSKELVGSNYQVKFVQ